MNEICDTIARLSDDADALEARLEDVVDPSEEIALQGKIDVLYNRMEELVRESDAVAMHIEKQLPENIRERLDALRKMSQARHPSEN